MKYHKYLKSHNKKSKVIKYPIRDIFQTFYPAYLKTIKSENFWHSKVINAISICKTEALGGHSTICEDCGDTQNHYNSCKNRHCPNCQSLVQAKWIDKRTQDVLNTDYYHTVFTIPEELNNLFISNKDIMYKFLFDASAKTIKKLAKDKKYLGADTGFISIIHTHGSNLSYHPHIHMILLGGGLTKDLKFKTSKYKHFLFPAKVIAAKFRNLFLENLDDLYYENQSDIFFYDKTIYLKDEVKYQRFRNLLKSKQWNVHIKETLKGAENVIKYLGRYTHRVAISNSRIISVTDTEVKFLYKDYKNKKTSIMTLHPTEFIRRFTMHILPRGFIKIRHYGILSNRSKKTKVVICRNILKGIYPKSKLDGLTVPEMLLELFNIDIFKCTVCGSTALIKKPLVKIQRE